MTGNQDRFQKRIFTAALSLFLFSLMFSTFLAEGLAMVLLLAWLVFLRRDSAPQTILHLPLHTLVLAFFALRLLSIATSIEPAASVSALRKVPFLLIFFPMSWYAGRHGARELRRAIVVIIFAAFAASVVGLTKAAFHSYNRLYSTTSGPGTLAMFLSCALSMGAGLVAAQETILSLPVVIPAGAMMAALTYTYCRAPWVVALGLSLALLRKRVKALAMTGLLIAGALATLPGMWIRMERALGWPPDLGDREVIWEAGVQALMERPVLGYGPNTFDLVFTRRDELKDQGAGAWHNFILQLWLESGVLAVLIFGWILVRAGQVARRVWIQASQPEEQAIIVSLAAGIAALLLSGLFGGLIGDPIIDLLFWTLLGMLVGACNQKEFEPRMDANKR